MNACITKRSGITLLEMVTVVAIIAIMSALAIPSFMGVMNLINHARCYLNQRHIRDAVLLYYNDRPFVDSLDGFGDGEVFIDLTGKVVGDPDRDLSDLIDNSGVFDCPSDGLAADVDTTPDYLTDGYVVTCLTDKITRLKSDGKAFVHDYPKEVLWRHNVLASEEASDVVLEPTASTEPTTPPIPPVPPEPPAPLTSLGSNFQEITSSMIALVEKFYDKYGKYPRSWDDYVYTDIGLNPEEWKKAYDGIIYSPGGNRIKVTPEDGYVFYTTGLDGKERALKSSNKWSLWYSMESGKWYYHTITDKNEIDISTLRVEKIKEK